MGAPQFVEMAKYLEILKERYKNMKNDADRSPLITLVAVVSLAAYEIEGSVGTAKSFVTGVLEGPTKDEEPFDDETYLTYSRQFSDRALGQLMALRQFIRMSYEGELDQ